MPKDMDAPVAGERACWYCGSLVKIGKGKRFVDGGEKCLVHVRPCMNAMLSTDEYTESDFTRE